MRFRVCVNANIRDTVKEVLQQNGACDGRERMNAHSPYLAARHESARGCACNTLDAREHMRAVSVRALPASHQGLEAVLVFVARKREVFDLIGARPRGLGLQGFHVLGGHLGGLALCTLFLLPS